MARFFLWQKNKNQKGFHYIGWEKVCKPTALGGLGFHLTKDWVGPLRSRLAWDIIQQPNCILAQCILDKYGDSMWNPTYRRGDSRSWRVICDGAASLNLITRWRVGDGSSIDIFNHAWIRDMSLNRWPTFINVSTLEDSNVSYFITNDFLWQVDRLHECFGEDLVQLICQIQIEGANGDQIELCRQHSGRTITSLAYLANYQSENLQFKHLHQLHLQPRVLMFWWRIIWGAIPTRSWLLDHRISSEVGCPWGCQTAETMEHIITNCGRTNKVRAVLKKWGFALPIFTSLKDCLDNLCSPDRMGLKQAQLFCFMIYHLWRGRNEMIHKRPFQPPISLATFILATFVNFYSSPLLKQWDTNRPPRSFQSLHWCPPPSGWLKINVDGALLSNHLAGFGLVIRNHEGVVLKCGGSSMEHWDAAQVELEAIKFIQFCMEPSFLNTEGIIIEGDCSNIIHWFQKCFEKGEWRDKPHLSSTFELFQKFRNLLFHSIPRSCNKLAHVCAHEALKFKFSFVWNSIPSRHISLSTALEEDMAYI